MAQRLLHQEATLSTGWASVAAFTSRLLPLILIEDRA